MLYLKKQLNIYFYFCVGTILIFCTSISREKIIRNISQLFGGNLLKINNNGNTLISNGDRSFRKLIEKLKHGTHANCADIFNGNITIPWTETQNAHVKKFEEGYKKIMKETKIQIPEGHSGRFKDQVRIYYEIVQYDFVKTVCETGFNAGHSAFIWLNSNPHIHLYSFDIGVHNYTRPLASFLQELFPNRLTITYGDSRKTIPDFYSRHSIRCDIIVIDGGHFGNVPMADFDNFYKMKNNLMENILVIDDWPSKIFKKVGGSWKYALSTNRAKLIKQCFREIQIEKEQGITIGQII